VFAAVADGKRTLLLPTPMSSCCHTGIVPPSAAAYAFRLPVVRVARPLVKRSPGAFAYPRGRRV